ncbi:MAG: helix-turn-helix transcriptional regulator [Mycobacterium sp.]|nr:helix-turn-helix transcriptional regulator [Mycobacterium sp.]
MTEAPWAAVIKARREKLGLSQAQLARAANVPKGTFQRYETGEREPPLTAAKAIGEALDVSLAELAGQVPAGLEPSHPGALSVVGEIMQARRRELGLTQTRAANTAGLALDLYQRYENGDAQPTLADAAAICAALDIGLSTLAGINPRPVDFSGQWWSTWQGAPGARDLPDLHTVSAKRIGDFLLLDDAWRAYLQIFSNESLIGWYRPPARTTRSRQSVFLWLPAGADYFYGRWTGIASNNTVISGWCVMARDEATSRDVFEQLVQDNTQPRPAVRLPELGGWGSSA